jgi:hypothetical protein
VISFCSPFTLPFFDCSVFIYLPLMRLILLFSAWILWLYCFYLVCSNVCSCLICRRCDSIGNFARETGRIQLIGIDHRLFETLETFLLEPRKTPYDSLSQSVIAHSWVKLSSARILRCDSITNFVGKTEWILLSSADHCLSLSRQISYSSTEKLSMIPYLSSVVSSGNCFFSLSLVIYWTVFRLFCFNLIAFNLFDLLNSLEFMTLLLFFCMLECLFLSDL